MSKGIRTLALLIVLLLAAVNSVPAQTFMLSNDRDEGEQQLRNDLRRNLFLSIDQARKLRESNRVNDAIALLTAKIPLESDLVHCNAYDLLPLYVELAELNQQNKRESEYKRYMQLACNLLLVGSSVLSHSRYLGSEALRGAYKDFALEMTSDDKGLVEEFSATPYKEAWTQEYFKIARRVPPSMVAATAASPDVDNEARRLLVLALKNHVVNVGKDGLLSKNGLVASSPVQVDEMFRNLEVVEKKWVKSGTSEPQHVVIYLHGGLTSEDSIVANAMRHLPFWYKNHIYPLYFVWHTDISDLLQDGSENPRENQHKVDIVNSAVSLVGPMLNDEQIEAIARHLITPMWEWMKGKALMASASVGSIDWTFPKTIPDNIAAGSLLVSRLKIYSQKHPNVKFHFVGHSAGAIFCAGLLEACDRYGVSPSTVSFLAPAIRVGEFQKLVLPHLSSRTKFTIFNLDNQRELGDSCILNGAKYRKSLLYLVSRALERPNFGEPESRDNPGCVPLLGLAVFADQPMNVASRTLREALAQIDGKIFTAPSASPLTGQTNSMSHGGFAEDVATIDSVARLITGKSSVVSYGDRKHVSQPQFYWEY